VVDASVAVKWIIPGEPWEAAPGLICPLHLSEGLLVGRVALAGWPSARVAARGTLHSPTGGMRGIWWLPLLQLLKGALPLFRFEDRKWKRGFFVWAFWRL